MGQLRAGLGMGEVVLVMVMASGVLLLRVAIMVKAAGAARRAVTMAGMATEGEEFSGGCGLLQRSRNLENRDCSGGSELFGNLPYKNLRKLTPPYTPMCRI